MEIKNCSMCDMPNCKSRNLSAKDDCLLDKIKQSEEPVSDDLEKAINFYIENNFFGSETLGFFSNRTKEEPNDQDIALAFKAGANWGKNQTKVEIQAQSMALAHGCHKEPVSEDLPHIRHRDILNEFAYQCAYDLSNDWAKENADWHDVEIACKLGAHWQREKMEANRIAHCNNITEEQYNLETGFINQHIEKNNRMPTFLDAIEYGMKKQREQMMKDAIDVTVHIDAGGYPYIPQIELYDYDKDAPLAKEGDKYKVILIKE